MKSPAKAALAHRASATRKDLPKQEGKLTTYRQVVNYPLATNASDDVVANVEAETTNFKPREIISRARFSEIELETQYAAVMYTMSHGSRAYA